MFSPSKYRNLVKTINDLITLVTELKADYNIAVTLMNELKADYNLFLGHVLNMALGAAGLAEGTNASTIQTVNAIDFSIGGRLYSKAATDNIAMTAAAAQAAEMYCMYLVSINASGTVKITKGTDVATDTAVLPAVPASEAVIGAFKILTAAGTTFTSGTTDLSAAGITATFYDLCYANTGASAPTTIAAAVATTTVATVPASVTE